MNWILASGSPRRQGLGWCARRAGPDVPAGHRPRDAPGAGPEQTVRELSCTKAQEVAQAPRPEDIIIAADTIVYLDGALGKPRIMTTPAHAHGPVRREHIVYTGVAVLRGGELRQAARARGRALSRTHARRIERYIATGGPMVEPGLTALFRAAARCLAHLNGDIST